MTKTHDHNIILDTYFSDFIERFLLCSNMYTVESSTQK